jgi:hypothetical protein
MPDPTDSMAGAQPDAVIAAMPDAAAVRAVIAGRLTADVPQIAEVYEVGLDIVNRGPAEAHKYVLAHTMREIRTKLPLHYGVASTGRFDYTEAVEQFSDDWVMDVRPRLEAPNASAPVTDAVTIAHAIASEIDALVDGHAQIPGTIREKYVRLNERVNPTTFPQTATGGVIDQWLDLRLDGMAHMPGPGRRSYSLTECLDAWRIMEEYLYYIFAPATVTYNELDSILEDANAT